MWRRLPAPLLALRPLQSYGRWLQKLTCRTADREMYLGTSFLRNRPALELIRRLVADKPQGATARIVVLGCSIGAEVYSIVWTLKRARPDLNVVVQAVDISRDVLAIAERGVYGPDTSEVVHSELFNSLTEAERSEMFTWHGEEGTIKPWLRERITWRIGDASDPALVDELGPQDLVVASNFLCHMDARAAEASLRTFCGLAAPGGYLMITGVDLDVRTKVALDLGWEPVPELLEEIHEGDPLLRADWPWRWWGLEPLDRRRRDWRTRYASVFRLSTPGPDLSERLGAQPDPSGVGVFEGGD